MTHSAPEEPGTPPELTPGISPCRVTLPRAAVAAMIRVARALDGVARLPAYQARLVPILPETARHDPGHHAVMMGYDFHLTPDGPRLIEVNTNAGGFWLAWRSHGRDTEAASLAGRAPRRLLGTFLAEYALFRRDPAARPRRVVILDAAPTGQFLYPEMEACARLFRQHGMEADVVDAGQLEMGAEGVFLDGAPVDVIYNRHCDFYLETPPLAGLRAAWLAGKVCLSPNPRAYGLLADKRRLPLLGEARFLLEVGASRETAALLATHLPASRMLGELEREACWQQRKQQVFKPVTLHGGRGVLVGSGLTRGRFDGLDPEQTLVQRFAPPGLVFCPELGREMKSDVRLFAYQEQILGVGVRLYRGQVTTLREPGHGYGRVAIK